MGRLVLFPWVVEAFQVLLGIEDDEIVQELIGVLLRDCAFLVKELWKFRKEMPDIAGNLRKRIEGLNDMPYNLSDFIGLLRILLAIPLRPPRLSIAIVRLLLVEVLMPDKYFVLFHEI